jgi:cytochrome c oxidase subunit 2
MFTDLPLFPPQASTYAAQVDALYYFLVAVASFFTVLIFSLVIVFAIKYRRRKESEVPRPPGNVLGLELTWSIIPLGLTMIMFTWGANLYFDLYHRVPANSLEIYVVGKQWMWYLQHPTGQREINQLHVPLGRPVKLTMATEDVIHSFFVPAFRIKRDVVPGRYATVWFQATQTGSYHLFCAEYCGTKHSGMIGTVTVLEPVQYQQWLAGGGALPPPGGAAQLPPVGVAPTPGGAPTPTTTPSPAAAGKALFDKLGCNTCHPNGQAGLGPSLAGLFGKPVPLTGEKTVIADEAYIRESILNPEAKIVAGYAPVMPTFQGQINERGLMDVIAYIKSLK